MANLVEQLDELAKAWESGEKPSTRNGARRECARQLRERLHQAGVEVGVFSPYSQLVTASRVLTAPPFRWIMTFDSQAATQRHAEMQHEYRDRDDVRVGLTQLYKKEN